MEGTFTQRMVVKMPKDMKNVEANEKLRWEKNILANLRGAKESIYLPKYYHTVQQHFKVKAGILMDYISGDTLH